MGDRDAATIPNDTPVSMMLVPLHIDLFPEDHRRQGLLRSLPKWLSLLWSVDAAEPDLVLLAVGIEHGDGIAVRHANNSPRERFRRRADADHQQHRRKHEISYVNLRSLTHAYSKTPRAENSLAISFLGSVQPEWIPKMTAELTLPESMSPCERAAEITTILAAAIVRTQLAQAAKQREVDLGFLHDQRVHTTPYQERRL